MFRIALAVSFLTVLLPSKASAQIARATTVQLPTFGIAIDAEGVITRKESADEGGRLHAARIAAAKKTLPADVSAAAKLRVVSLTRLERAIQAKLSAGLPPDEAMQMLAGLTRIQFVFCLPDAHEVLIAGPAEGWVEDGVGRKVGIESGRPVLLLEDLLIALRAFPPGRADKPFIGCTIDPSAEGLQRLQAFQRSLPKVVPQQARSEVALRFAAGMQESLGMADVRVFGVPANTHFAQVMIEADYRMKLIGIGLEPPPVKMITFIGALSSAPSANALQRWWFTPNYKCVRVADDRLGMELVGEGVQLQSEDKVIGPDGKLLNAAGVPSKASDLFATSFTAKYADIAEKSPVFGQLRNNIDLLVAAAFLQREDYYGRAEWSPRVFHDEKALPTQTRETPKRAPCVANSLWKGSRLFTPAGGGVSILPQDALLEANVLKDDGSVAKQKAKLAADIPADEWWWD